MSSFGTIYIMSKGRPHCKTAKALTQMDYPDDWFIVCGNNDETLEEYRERWGSRVLVFDWFEDVALTDLMDNFGYKDVSSGATPARNAIMRISHERGEVRHWQFDDDYSRFALVNHDLTKFERIEDGQLFRDELVKIAQFADQSGLSVVGFGADNIAFPYNAKTYNLQVFNALCLSSDPEKFMPWRGRISDDAVNVMDVYRAGGYEIRFKHLVFSQDDVMVNPGGLSDLYEDNGTLRRVGYALLAMPAVPRLNHRKGKAGIKNYWARITPKVIREDFHHGQ